MPFTGTISQTGCLCPHQFINRVKTTEFTRKLVGLTGLIFPSANDFGGIQSGLTSISMAVENLNRRNSDRFSTAGALVEALFYDGQAIQAFVNHLWRIRTENYTGLQIIRETLIGNARSSLDQFIRNLGLLETRLPLEGNPLLRNCDGLPRQVRAMKDFCLDRQAFIKGEEVSFAVTSFDDIRETLIERSPDLVIDTGYLAASDFLNMSAYRLFSLVNNLAGIGRKFGQRPGQLFLRSEDAAINIKVSCRGSATTGIPDEHFSFPQGSLPRLFDLGTFRSTYFLSGLEEAWWIVSIQQGMIEVIFQPGEFVEISASLPKVTTFDGRLRGLFLGTGN